MACVQCGTWFQVFERPIVAFYEDQTFTLKYNCCERCFEISGGYCDRCQADRELFAAAKPGIPEANANVLSIYAVCIPCCRDQALVMDGQRALSLLAFAEKYLSASYTGTLDRLAQCYEVPAGQEPWRQQLFGICFSAAMHRQTPEEHVSALLRSVDTPLRITQQFQ